MSITRSTARRRMRKSQRYETDRDDNACSGRDQNAKNGRRERPEQSSVYAATIIRGKMRSRRWSTEGAKPASRFISIRVSGAELTGNQSRSRLANLRSVRICRALSTCVLQAFSLLRAAVSMNFRSRSTGASSFTMHGTTAKVDGQGSRTVQVGDLAAKKGAAFFRSKLIIIAAQKIIFAFVTASKDKA